MKTLSIVYFPGLDLTTAVVQVGNATYPPSTLCSGLPGINPQFFIGKGINGEDILCTVKTTDTPSNLTMIWTDGTSTGNIDAVLAPPTVEVEFVGGRPVVVR